MSREGQELDIMNGGGFLPVLEKKALFNNAL